MRDARTAWLLLDLCTANRIPVGKCSFNRYYVAPDHSGSLSARHRPDIRRFGLAHFDSREHMIVLGDPNSPREEDATMTFAQYYARTAASLSDEALAKELRCA